MEFDCLIRKKTDVDRVLRAEQAIKKGRKAWCYWQLYREIQYRFRNLTPREPADIRFGTGFEKRLARQFQSEFNEDPLIELERMMTADLDDIRR